MNRHRSSGDAEATMIVPQGTQIDLDAEGKLSISVPGNLVVQNSGTYGRLESVHGSIRIEPGVDVEATVVRCAETCFVQGNLTSWKVEARVLNLEGEARAQIVLQETERLELGKGSRLVGNFDSEKELFGLFSRFANQVRSIGDDAGATTPAAVGARAIAGLPMSSESPSSGTEAMLLDVRTSLLELQGPTGGLSGVAERARDELIKLLDEADLETLRHTYGTLLERIEVQASVPSALKARVAELVQTTS